MPHTNQEQQMEHLTNPNMAFLTAKEVEEIKKLIWEAGTSQRTIAVSYNVTQSTISNIVQGRTWPEVPWPGGHIGNLPAGRRKYMRIMTRKRAKLARYFNRDESPDMQIGPGEMDPQTAVSVAKKQDIEREQYGELPDEWWKNEEILNALKQGDVYKFRERYKEDAIPPPSVQAEIQPETREQQEKLMPWKDVLLKGADNGLVIQAVKEKDKLLKKAIRMLYYVTEQDSWEDERIIGLILSTKELLSKQE